MHRMRDTFTCFFFFFFKSVDLNKLIYNSEEYMYTIVYSIANVRRYVRYNIIDEY